MATIGLQNRNKFMLNKPRFLLLFTDNAPTHEEYALAKILALFQTSKLKG